MDEQNYKESAYYKKTTDKERGGAIADNPSSIDLSFERKVRLNRQSLSHSSDGTKVGNSTVKAKKYLQIFADEGHANVDTKDINSLVRSLGEDRPPHERFRTGSGPSVG